MKSILRTMFLVALCAGGTAISHAMTTLDGSVNDANTTQIRTTASSTALSTRTNTGITQEQLRCLQSATMKRESTLGAAFTTFSTAMTNAYSARADRLEGAWSIVDRKERKTVIETSWKTWKTSADAAKKTRKETHRSAWNTFKTEVKACKVSSVDIDTNGASLDSGN